VNLYETDVNGNRDFRDRVREGVGRVAKAEYSDELIDKQITRALREFSRWVSKLVPATLEITADQHVYSAKEDLDPPGMVVLGIASDSLSRPPSVVNDSLSSYFQADQPAVTLATDVWLDRYEAEVISRDSEEGLELNGDQIVLYRGPNGTSEGTVHLWIRTLQDPENFPDRYVEEFLMLVKSMVGEDLIALRSKYKQFSAGGSRVNVNTSDLARMVKEWKADWKSRIGASAVPMT